MPDEVNKILSNMTGVNWLMASLLYGSGLRLMECIRLRVKDVDFYYKQIIVRDGKGSKVRVTVLPQKLTQSLQQQIKKVEILHKEDLHAGYGEVEIHYTLIRKYPNVG